METRNELPKSRFQIVQLEERIAPSGLSGLRLDVDVDIDIKVEFDKCGNGCKPNPCHPCGK